MRTLGAGELTGLRTRDLAHQEHNPILRNSRIREERMRARMRGLCTVPPKAFPSGALGRIERFHLVLIRVGPGELLSPADLRVSLEHIADGICDHLGCATDSPRVRLELRQERGKWSVRFVVSEDGEVLS